MCDHCQTLRMAIRKAQKMSEGGFDQLTTQRIRIFVETLQVELDQVETRPDHRTVNPE